MLIIPVIVTSKENFFSNLEALSSDLKDDLHLNNEKINKILKTNKVNIEQRIDFYLQKIIEDVEKLNEDKSEENIESNKKQVDELTKLSTYILKLKETIDKTFSSAEEYFFIDLSKILNFFNDSLDNIKKRHSESIITTSDQFNTNDVYDGIVLVDDQTELEIGIMDTILQIKEFTSEVIGKLWKILNEDLDNFKEFDYLINNWISNIKNNDNSKDEKNNIGDDSTDEEQNNDKGEKMSEWKKIYDKKLDDFIINKAYYFGILNLTIDQIERLKAENKLIEVIGVAIDEDFYNKIKENIWSKDFNIYIHLKIKENQHIYNHIFYQLVLLNDIIKNNNKEKFQNVLDNELFNRSMSNK